MERIKITKKTYEELNKKNRNALHLFERDGKYYVDCIDEINDFDSSDIRHHANIYLDMVDEDDFNDFYDIDDINDLEYNYNHLLEALKENDEYMVKTYKEKIDELFRRLN